MSTGQAQRSCVFCAIAAGRETASMVYSDDTVIAFMDVRPVNAGHLLVVPRSHAERLADLPDDVGSRMFTVASRLAGALRRSSLRCEGVNLFLADGEAAGQEVLHVHLHVLPRFAGDGFRYGVWPSASWLTPDRAELDETAATVRHALDGDHDK